MQEGSEDFYKNGKKNERFSEKGFIRSKMKDYYQLLR